MQLRKIFRTIEEITNGEFESTEDMLKHVIQELVKSEQILIKGGRSWKFDPKSGSYELLNQVGEIDRIKSHYRVKLKDYPIFYELPKRRTMLGSEQDEYLRRRGIMKYSATGIGDKIRWRGRELYKYVLAFNADHLDEDLTSALNIISAAVTTALRTRRFEHKAHVLEQDLDKARAIQRSILPQHEMKFKSFELYGVSVADQTVGGDFFDYLQVEGDDERLGVVIGDATSKGLSAAVQALFTAGAIRMGFEFQTKIGSLLSKVNRLLHKTFSEEQFVSLFYAELTDDKNGLVLYANCGHNNPIHYSSAGRKAEFLEATGQMLGPFPDEVFKVENILMNKGDILLLYTDGISEATNEQGEAFGEDRIVECIKEQSGASAKEITQRLLEVVQNFNSLGTRSDDKTIVTIKRAA